MNERSEKQDASNEIILPHQRFDIVAKDPFYTFPEDMLQFLMGGDDFEFIEHVDSSLTTVEVRHMDILIKVLRAEKPVLVHCEIQTDDSTHPNMVQRNVGYLGRCFEKYGLPIYSFVLYLRSTAGVRDPGGYFQDVPRHRFIVEYQVIRLNEIDGEKILQTQQPGLMPFTPLMKPPVNMSSVEWTTHCVEVTQSLSVDTAARDNLLVELWVMSGLRHERQDLLTILSEDIVKESSVYEMIIERGMERGIEQGIEQGKQLGAKTKTIEFITDLLDKRFEMSTAQILTPLLQPIDDLEQLKQLFHEALEVEHLEDFIRSAQTAQNGA
ncbi:MAG: hypothetical protein OXI67_08575 [Candidatus Poribacteria bacterium]|nr:hypothetical protein [Candidatus Poribacteria bacterium]